MIVKRGGVGQEGGVFKGALCLDLKVVTCIDPSISQNRFTITRADRPKSMFLLVRITNFRSKELWGPSRIPFGTDPAGASVRWASFSLSQSLSLFLSLSLSLLPRLLLSRFAHPRLGHRHRTRRSMQQVCPTRSNISSSASPCSLRKARPTNFRATPK